MVILGNEAILREISKGLLFLRGLSLEVLWCSVSHSGKSVRIEKQGINYSV